MVETKRDATGVIQTFVLTEKQNLVLKRAKQRAKIQYQCRTEADCLMKWIELFEIESARRSR